jgi:teichuronic acid biosynthesis glycosyltransferase TuaG
MTTVSVIIPYFKKKFFFLKCIRSVLKQTHKKFEIIIINDENTKSSIDFLNKIKKIDHRIRLINNLKNLGAGISRNIGIRNSTGKYIAFLDADDTWHKNKLNIQLNHMKKYKIFFSHTNYFIIDKNNKKIGYQIAPLKINYINLLNSCDIGLSTVMVDSKIKKELIFKNLKTKEDYALWLRLSKKYPICGINKFYTNWRSLNNSLSSSIIRKIIDAFYVYYRFEKFNIFKSLLLVLNISLFSIRKKYKQYFSIIFI